MNKNNLMWIVRVTYILIFIAFGFYLFSTSKVMISYELSNREISNFLKENKYSDAMKLIGGYFNNEYVYLDNINGKDVVIYESATLSEDKLVISNSFSVFVYPCMDEFKKVIVNGSYEIELESSTKTDFLYFVLDDSFSSIESIKLVSNDYDDIVINKNLSFETDFYNDLKDFIIAYNKNESVDVLIKEEEKFKNGHDNYIKSVSGKSILKTNKYLVYIMSAYSLLFILGLDLIVGKRYLIKPFKKLKNQLSKKKEDN